MTISLPSNTSLLGGVLKNPYTKKLKEALWFDVASCSSYWMVFPCVFTVVYYSALVQVETCIEFI